MALRLGAMAAGRPGRRRDRPRAAGPVSKGQRGGLILVCLTIPNLAGQGADRSRHRRPADLGVTMTHEPIFVAPEDASALRRWWFRDDRLSPENRTRLSGHRACLWDAKLDLSNLHLARSGGHRRNYLLATRRRGHGIAYFSVSSGARSFDVDPSRLKRDPIASKVRRATGLHIVMGTAYYSACPPRRMVSADVEHADRTIARDVTVGIFYCAAYLAGVGDSADRLNGGPLITNERKSMRAGRRASRCRGPIVIHLAASARKATRCSTHRGRGVDLRNVTQGHSDDIAGDLPLS